LNKFEWVYLSGLEVMPLHTYGTENVALVKWAKEVDYRLKKELWCFADNRIAVRFEYEWHDDSGFWYRSYGNENWKFAENGLMMRRFASINDIPIQESERKFRS
jgi:uncharacterized protein